MNKEIVIPNKDEESLDKLNNNAENHNDFGLLFCYFNNSNAFNNYVDNYKGNVIVIIGPKEGQNVYTEPLPWKPMFRNSEEWNLNSQKSMGNGRDLIAFYKRNR